MSRSAFFSLITTIGITGYSIAPLSYAQEVDNMDVYSMCMGETKHTTLYEHGKKLAEGWMFWIKTEEGKKYPPKTKKSFFSSAMLGLTQKYKIPQENIIYYCYMGYAKTYKEATWSSVHKVLVDYFHSQSKTKFLSLPER